MKAIAGPDPLPTLKDVRFHETQLPAG